MLFQLVSPDHRSSRSRVERARSWAELAAVIQAGGGILIRPYTGGVEANAILLANPEDREALEEPASCVSTDYIRDSLERNAHLDIEDYRFKPLHGQTWTTRIVGRSAYTEDEEDDKSGLVFSTTQTCWTESPAVPRDKPSTSDVQQLSPEPPHIKEETCPPDVQQVFILEIKEEEDLWPIEEGGQLQGLQSDTNDTIFTSPTIKPHFDPEDSSKLPSLDQTVENKDRDSSPTNSTGKEIKAESNGEDCEAPEPARDAQPPSVGPWASTQARVRLRPISSFCSGSESEDFSGEAKRKPARRPYQCGECDKAFVQEHALARHRRTHTGEKLYQCEECGKAFDFQCNLVQHRRTHTAEKPYQCEECGKAYSQKCNLVQHRRTHTGERPYQCEECDKAFVGSRNLLHHRRTHTGERPYQCEKCDKAFTVRKNLVHHRRTHSAERPYQCEECDKAFKSQSNLVQHARTHSR